MAWRCILEYTIGILFKLTFYLGATLMILRSWIPIIMATLLGIGLPAYVMATPKSISPQGQTLDRMVAVVNNDTITGSELEYQTNLLLLRLKQNTTELPPMAEFKKQILERMIMEKVQLQIASETGIDVDEATLNQTLDEIAERDGMPISQMHEFLEEQGIPFTYFKDTVKKELILSRLQQKEVGQHISVSKTDIEHFLNSPQGQDRTGCEYRLGHILIALPETPTPEAIENAKKEAEDLKKQLVAGANFKTLAIAKSAGPQALQGGDLGWKKGTELPTLFAKQTLLMSVNEIYGPIRNTSGFHLIKLLDKHNKDEHAEKLQTLTRVRQILIKADLKKSDQEAKALLEQVRNQIQQGAEFSTMAKKYSEEQNSATKGGDLGWVTQQSLLKPFYKEVSSLKPGDISQPFKTELGWHLIQITDRKTQKNASEVMRHKAMDILYQRKFEDQLSSWLKRIRAEAEVRIY